MSTTDKIKHAIKYVEQGKVTPWLVREAQPGTIVRNGKKIVDNREIAGITGGAIDANEGEPGVFYIQGDHTGGMKYRNIMISVPQK